jgi:glycosyltransferase involved in cell wall biosynthesis
MIVKNESAIIRSTLENLTSYVKFAYWVICDTGSTDGTQNIIQTFFAEKNIPGELHQDEWKDFGHNRSLALQRAYESKKADYLLIFDADDAFRGNFKLPNPLQLDRYSCKFGYGTDFTWYRPVILNNKIQWKYFGVLHEYVDCIEPNYNPKSTYLQGDYYIEARTIGGDRNKDSKKYEKDALLLEKALEQETDAGLKARYAFYCGQSFRDCGQLENAIKYYRLRTTLGHFDEEIQVSFHNVGKMLSALNKPEEEVEKAFLDGYNCMRDRVECLYDLSKYFRLKGNYAKGYLYAELGRRIKFPSHRVLFLHKDMYEWRIHDECAISAFYLGKHDLAVKLNQKLLQHHFDERFISNMRFSVKSIVERLAQPAGRSLRICKNRFLGLTMVLNFSGNLPLIMTTINSLFMYLRDLYKVERFIILVDQNELQKTETIKKEYPFFEFVVSKHKSHILKNLKAVLNRKDRFIFYIEEGWICIRNHNYFHKSLSLLNLESKYGQYIFNRNDATQIEDFKNPFPYPQLTDIERQNESNKYGVKEGHKRLSITPSIIKREFLDDVSEFDKDCDGGDYLAIYQNQIDFLKNQK